MPPETEVKVDLSPEALKQQNTLTEDQSAAIALEVLREEEAAKGKSSGEPSEEEQKATEEAERIAEEKKVEDEKKAAEETEKKAADDKKPEDQLTEEEKATLAKEQEETKKKDEEQLNKDVESYATEHKVSVEDAKEIFEHSRKIGEKYSNDPKKIAIANLHLQRLVSAKEEELKKAKNAPSPFVPPNSESIKGMIIDGKITLNGKIVSKEDAVEAFREENPSITENVEEDVVLNLMVKDIQGKLSVKAKDDLIATSSQAREKRETLMSSLAEGDRRFAGEIKLLVEKVNDSHIVREDFNLEPYIRYAKGGVLEKEVKEAEDKGYKRGREEAKIIAKRPDAGVGKGSGGGEKKGVVLTDAEKEEALSMFDNFPDTTDEKKYEMFKEIKTEEELKRKSNGG